MRARFGAPLSTSTNAPASIPPEGFALSLDVITMVGAEYVLAKPASGEWCFPSDEFLIGESPAHAARRVVHEWTGTTNPKLELVDWRVTTKPWEIAFVFRALLTEEPKPTPRVAATKRAKRMELPPRVGRLEGPWVDDALKTGLNYKLTRAAAE